MGPLYYREDSISLWAVLFISINLFNHGGCEHLAIVPVRSRANGVWWPITNAQFMICCKVQPFWPWEVCATIKEARDKCRCQEILGWKHHWVAEGLPIAFPAISTTTQIRWSRIFSGLWARRMLAFCQPLSCISKPGMERPTLERSWALYTQAFK